MPYHVQDRSILASLSRLRKGFQKLITWLSGGTATGEAGSVTEVNFSTGLSAVQSGNRLTVTASGGGGGVQTINTVSPDGSGDFTIESTDSSVSITPVTHGVNLSVGSPPFGPGCVFTNGGLLLSGTLTSEIEVPYNFAGTGWTIVGNTTGSASIVVSHSDYATYDTMTTLFTATVSSAKKNQGTVSFSLSAGDIVRFSGSGFSGFTRCSIQLDGTAS